MTPTGFDGEGEMGAELMRRYFHPRLMSTDDPVIRNLISNNWADATLFRDLIGWAYAQGLRDGKEGLSGSQGAVSDGG